MRRHLFALLLAAPLAAQSLESGYVTEELVTLPDGAGNVLALPNHGGVVFFTGTDLVLQARGASRSLLTLPSQVFGSFTIEVGPGLLLFGEGSNGDLWLVPLAPALAPRVLANVAFNYDAVAIAPDRVVVSAKTGGFASPDNDLVAVDLVTGATDVVARVGGSSGPVAWTEAGLHYATASASFPPPPGATRVLLWSPAAVQRGLGVGHLTERDALQLAAGIDAAGDLVVDGDEDLIVVDWVNAQLLEISRGRGIVTRPSTLLGYPSTTPQPATLQLVQGAPPTVPFEPFEPRGATTLFVHESTFGATSRLRVVAPRRAQTSAPSVIPPGRFAVTTSGGPPNGLGIVAIAPSPNLTEQPLALPGFEQLVLWAPSFYRAWDTLPVAFDARGVATLQLFNPGAAGSPLAVGAQCAFVDATATIIGSTPPILLNLR